METYSKLKNTWVVIERYGNITGSFGGTPNYGQVIPAYDIGYRYGVVYNGPEEYTCKKNTGNLAGVT